MPDGTITDRAVLNALFNLVATMAKQMTGLTPSVKVYAEGGRPGLHVNFVPEEAEVRWLDDRGREVHVGALPAASPKSS